LPLVYRLYSRDDVHTSTKLLIYYF
jgi:hypothetical protein